MFRVSPWVRIPALSLSKCPQEFPPEILASTKWSECFGLNDTLFLWRVSFISKEGLVTWKWMRTNYTHEWPCLFGQICLVSSVYPLEWTSLETTIKEISKKDFQWQLRNLFANKSRWRLKYPLSKLGNCLKLNILQAHDRSPTKSGP